MKPLVERHGSWSIAVSDIGTSATFVARDWRSANAGAGISPIELAESSACVEVLQFGGGLTPRALLGGSFVSGGQDLLLEVGSTGVITLGAPRGCLSQLGGPLVAGLPAEFVDAVLRGLLEMAGKVERPAGTLRIQAAGYDEENSSPYAFVHAGAALLWIVSRQLLTPGGFVDGLTEIAATW
jgi:hypothetical protein